MPTSSIILLNLLRPTDFYWPLRSSPRLPPPSPAPLPHPNSQNKSKHQLRAVKQNSCADTLTPTVGAIRGCCSLSEELEKGFNPALPALIQADLKERGGTQRASWRHTMAVIYQDAETSAIRAEETRWRVSAVTKTDLGEMKQLVQDVKTLQSKEEIKPSSKVRDL